MLRSYVLFILLVLAAIGLRAQTVNINNVFLTHPTCAGNDGMISVEVLDGTPPLQFSINFGSFQSSEKFFSLSAGTYTLVVEDANGATDTATATLINTPPPSIASIVTTNTLCGNTNGAINITATGNTQLHYSIDSGATFVPNNVFTGLPAGDYDVVVSDNNFCEVRQAVTLVDNVITITSNVTAIDPLCYSSDGLIILTPTNGSWPYEYSPDANGTFFGPDSIFANLIVGQYDFVIKDANGCTGTATATLTSATGPVVMDMIATKAFCGGSNATLTVVAMGGTGAIQYSIDGGGTYQADSVFTGLAPGVYGTMVMDDNNCFNQGQSITIGDTTISLTGAAATTPAACGATDGTIAITISNGTPPYEYSIDGNTTYQVQNTFTGLGAGNYTIDIRDANGCTGSVQSSLSNAGGPAITVASTNPTCGNSDGSISVTLTGGTAPFQYSIDNGATFQAGNSFTALSNGTYDVVVKDVNNCQSTGQATLTSDTLDISVTQVNATLAANLTGATYQWLDCDNNYEPLPTNANLAQYVATASGNYAVAITKNGCTDTSACYNVLINGVEEMPFAASIKLYPNPTNGWVNIEATSAQDLTYSISNTLGQTLQQGYFPQAHNISFQIHGAAGIYIVMLKNNIGQTAIFRIAKE